MYNEIPDDINDEKDINVSDDEWDDEDVWRTKCEIIDEIERRAEHIRREALDSIKMSVIFFEMRIYPNMQTILFEFGHNIPRYTQYEGGSYDGMTVVCCVDSSIDAKSICIQNGVCYTELREIEIDKMMYNNSHRVYYGDDGFTLRALRNPC